ncbi:hypothetical protein AC578_3861 [Pseudocercospora eumusae]|uniref:Uncharacterized protein n=1 Tax=Pseudocercospora eumusae TaxID=321146 RepID=A0A139GWY7_9PEZI|nr:hypothetical protein AC578_3861 [Pseudocercospora eumusae]
MKPPAPPASSSSFSGSRNEESAPNCSNHGNTSACPSSDCSITTCSVLSLSDPKIRHINGALRELNANELAALRPLIQSHIQQRKVLKQILSCDSTRFDALVTNHNKIHDFLHQVEVEELAGLQFLIERHGEMKKTMDTLVSEEKNLVDSCKPDESGVVPHLLWQFSANELERIKFLFEQCVKDRKTAAFIPHPSRCFFLEMPRELRDRIFVFLGRRYIAAVLRSLEQFSWGFTPAREDPDCHSNFAIWNINHQIQAEFTDMLCGPEVLCGQIWDSKARPPRWTMMPRSLFEICLRELFRRRRTCIADARWLDEARWPPEMLEILPGASSRVRIARIYWISFKAAGRRKHILLSCHRKPSSQAFWLWAYEATASMKGRLDRQWRVGVDKMRAVHVL